MTDAPEIELRVSLDPETLLGPGKAALLQVIDETGSIAAAGRRMGMSYKRAWYRIDTMNAYFSEPAVVSAKGGNSRGGAQLTATGRKVLESYRRMPVVPQVGADRIFSLPDGSHADRELGCGMTLRCLLFKDTIGFEMHLML
jgi:molybdate transport system regulatory protein